MLQQVRNFLEALGMTRRKHHHGLGIAGQHIFKGTQKNRLLFFHCASANDNRAGRGLLNCRTQCGHNRRRRSGRDIKLEIATDLHASCGRADLGETACVFLGLRQEEIHILQSSSQQKAGAAVSGP